MIRPPQFTPANHLTRTLLDPGCRHFISLPKPSPVMRRLVTTLNSICKNSLIFQPSFQGCRCHVAPVHFRAMSWISAFRHFLFITIPRCSTGEHPGTPPHFHDMPGKENMSRQKAGLELRVIFPPAAPWQLSAQEWQLGIYGWVAKSKQTDTLLRCFCGLGRHQRQLPKQHSVGGCV